MENIAVPCTRRYQKCADKTRRCMPITFPIRQTFGPVDTYIDEAGHPCVCLGRDENSVVWGISLIDGSWPRRRGPHSAETMKLSLREAFQLKIEGLSRSQHDRRPAQICAPPFYEDFLEGTGGSLEGTEYAHRNLVAGGFYEDCAYHPCLTMGVNAEEGDIWGISLVDGSWPRACCLDHCGVIPLTMEQAWRWKMCGPDETINDDPLEHSWWTANTVLEYERFMYHANRAP